jgi:hypothetical protein
MSNVCGRLGVRTGCIVVAALFLSTSAHAIPIAADVVGCVATACTAEPVGGPVDLDPNGFTLEVNWLPEFIALTENPPGGNWLLDLVFEFTGTHSGLEHMGVVTLLDLAGDPIGALNVQFDDLAPLNVANYEIFGPSDQAFPMSGLTLALSDMQGVDTLQFVRAVFSPAVAGVVNIPEPALPLLAGVACGLLAIRRAIGRRVTRAR